MFGLNLNLSIILGLVLLVLGIFGVMEFKIKFYKHGYTEYKQKYNDAIDIIKKQNISIENTKKAALYFQSIEKQKEVEMQKEIKAAYAQSYKVLSQKVPNDCDRVRKYLIDEAKGL